LPFLFEGTGSLVQVIVVSGSFAKKTAALAAVFYYKNLLELSL
jgi:hypothetical protein